MMGMVMDIFFTLIIAIVAFRTDESSWGLSAGT